MFRRTFGIAGFVLCAVSVAAFGSTLELFVAPHANGQHAVSVAPGATVPVDVVVNVPEAAGGGNSAGENVGFIGISFWLQDAAFDESYTPISVAGPRTMHGVWVTDKTTGDGALFDVGAAKLDHAEGFIGRNDRDMGATSSTISVNTANGDVSGLHQTFSLVIPADLPPGQYQIVTAGAGWVDAISRRTTPFDGATGLTINVQNDTEPPQMTAAVSMKNHGAAEFGINLFAGETECRAGGPTRVLITFNEPIVCEGDCDTADVTVSSGSVIGVSIVTATQLEVVASAIADAATSQLSFPGIDDLAGNSMAGTLCIRNLRGDVDGNGVVNVTDRIQTQLYNGQQASLATFRADGDANGTVSVTDRVQVQTNNGHLVGACP